jgi:putative restriction endonuclease
VDRGDRDVVIRLASFAFLREQVGMYGDLLPRTVLARGFVFEGVRVPLVGPQGIFKPAVLANIPLSITTAPLVEGKTRPYEDEFRYDTLVTYRYRGTDPLHRENVGLRTAMERNTPLVYLLGIQQSWYMPFFPVYVVGEEPENHSFIVRTDAVEGLGAGTLPEAADSGLRRYAVRLIQERVHQAGFRARVLQAYRVRCAVCRLREHPELLDAAHILPDGHPQGAAVVSNGLSLCKLHHAAFDANIIGIRPDHVMEVRRDVLAEIDGPMLTHGLQGVERQQIVVPHRQNLRPNPEFLEERYELFRQAS